MHETQAVGGYQGFSFVCILYTQVTNSPDDSGIYYPFRQTDCLEKTDQMER